MNTYDELVIFLEIKLFYLQVDKNSMFVYIFCCIEFLYHCCIEILLP